MALSQRAFFGPSHRSAVDPTVNGLGIELQAVLPRPLYVTRKFPPSVGGMETLAANIWAELQGGVPGSLLVAHGGRNRALIRWLPVAWWQTLWTVVTRRCDVVVTGDALMLVLLWPVCALLRVPTITLVMGLDLTWPNRYYHALLHLVVPRSGHVLAISEATAQAARKLGVRPARLSVIPLGIEAPDLASVDRMEACNRVRELLRLPDDTVILLTLGRLVERKGVRWFVAEVLPALPSNVHYAVAGSGPEQSRIEEVATAVGVRGRVHLLGAVNDAERELLLGGADLFVQPNVPVEGDVEGFGLVVVEAAMRGTPVVASALEGIEDAVVADETGVLCSPADEAEWRATVVHMIADPVALAAMGKRFQARALEHFGRERMAAALSEALAATVK